MFKYQYQLHCPESTGGALVCYGETITDNVLTVSAIRRRLAYIRDIYTDMLTDDAPAPASEDSILETLRGAVIDMIRVCDTLFSDFPRLLSDNAYKAKVIAIMQEPKQYILEIEGVRQ